MSITDALREAVRKSAESRNVLCDRAGIDPGALSRFMAGGDAKGATLDKLAEYFHLELRPRGRRT